MHKYPLGPVIPYLTLGDPDIPTSIDLACQMVKAGCPVIEMGVPFSDPIADGPVIQASHQRALNGVPRPTMPFLFEASRAIRSVGGFPVAMCSANLVLHHG
ncbi:tryptophan synthase subunit alpha, partial [bacterium]|nr:tryptophan synthase subunit alpha [bacterium]